jgi:hypothetical protein
MAFRQIEHRIALLGFDIPLFSAFSAISAISAVQMNFPG